ncbi:hypothetical protein BB561_004891, partial [Smittium simulii]
MFFNLSHLILFLLSASISLCLTQTSTFLTQNQFSHHKSTGLDTFIGTIMAIADVNGDKLLDLVLLSENKSQLDFLTYSPKEKKFVFFSSLPFASVLKSGDVDFTAVNVVFGDFLGNGRQALAIMGYEQKSNLQKLSIKLYTQSSTNSYVYHSDIGTFDQSQPVLFDYGKNLHVDML